MKIYKMEEYADGDNSIHIFLENKTIEEPLHSHNFIEIVYTLQGKATHYIDGTEYSISRGDMLFMNYGCSHRFIGDGDLAFINICFSPEILGEKIIVQENAFALLAFNSFNEMRAEAEGGKITFYAKERDEIENILYSMLSENTEKSALYIPLLENYLNIIITKMLRKSKLGLGDEALNGVWKELSDYIDENLGADLKLSTLARKCFYNPSYFSRIFKEKFGTSPVEYISRRRVDYAVKLLRETALTIDDIAAKVGFSDRSSFYSAFAKYRNQTPSEFRKEKRK